MKLAWKLLKTDWRTGELQLLFVALFLAVAIVTGLTTFVERLQIMLVGESSQFLAADRSLKSPRPVTPEWLQYANELGLQQAQHIGFQSMLYAHDDPLLVSVKAATDAYPLRGELKFRRTVDGEIINTVDGPAVGEIWAEKRLFTLLGLNVGAEILLGDAQLKLTAELVSEPDRGAGMFTLGPRVLMNWDDIDKTGVIQLGSRISYYYLFAGTPELIKQFEQWILPKLTDSHKWLDLQNTQPTVALSLNRAKSFFLLASSIIIILASLAIAMASSQFTKRHVKYVAVLKTLGATAKTIQVLYTSLLIIIMSLAVLCAWVVAYIFQDLVLQQVAKTLAVETPPVTFMPFLLGLFTAMISLAAFTLPPIYELGKVPAVRIFQQNTLDFSSFSRVGLFIAFIGLLLLMTLYTRDMILGSILLLSLVVLSLVIAVPTALLLERLGKINIKASTWFTLAASNIKRRLKINAMHVTVFSISLMLFVVLWGIKGSLFKEWQQQLPEKTPNYFIVNIQPTELDSIKNWLNAENITAEALYPMIRGRLIKINDKPVNDIVTQEQLSKAGADRELNLSWSDTLPPDNTLVAGEWWNNQDDKNQNGVSVEKQLAKNLKIELGDTLTFMIAAESFQAQVSSIREVEWDRMRPNFYMLFQQPLLESYPKTFMTSFWLPQESNNITRLLQLFPTIVVIELGPVIKQIRSIVQHVSLALELVLFFVIIGSLLVMAATVQNSLDERTKENTVIRALGGTRGLITGSLWAEFSLLGFIAGVLATIYAELILLVIQKYLLHIEAGLHPELWWIAPVTGCILVGLSGFLSAYKVLKVAPMQLLRAI